MSTCQPCLRQAWLVRRNIHDSCESLLNTFLPSLPTFFKQIIAGPTSMDTSPIERNQDWGSSEASSPLSDPDTMSDNHTLVHGTTVKTGIGTSLFFQIATRNLTALQTQSLTPRDPRPNRLRRAPQTPNRRTSESARPPLTAPSPPGQRGSEECVVASVDGLLRSLIHELFRPIPGLRMSRLRGAQARSRHRSSRSSMKPVAPSTAASLCI